MHSFTDRNDPELIRLLKEGAIGVVKTDTLYGIVAKASDAGAVERVFTVRGRDRHKSCIVLIADQHDLFDQPSGAAADFLDLHWPGPVSVALPSPSAPKYLQFHDGTVAYRMPADPELRELLKATGPLIAPSANLQGEPPAEEIEQAKAYFGEHVDAYVNSGRVCEASASQVWSFASGEAKRIR